MDCHKDSTVKSQIAVLNVHVVLCCFISETCWSDVVWDGTSVLLVISLPMLHGFMFQVPSREVDKDPKKFWTHWNRETKQVSLQPLPLPLKKVHCTVSIIRMWCYVGQFMRHDCSSVTPLPYI